MKHWEFKINDERIRAEWNEAATFNMQSRSYDDQWVDYHCFTVYGIESEQAALECILETMREEIEQFNEAVGSELWKGMEAIGPFKIAL
tara:strand:+ start:232 stop:498 length:267 start_codon:yes stop_codon:yes gene_type:complete